MALTHATRGHIDLTKQKKCLSSNLQRLFRYTKLAQDHNYWLEISLRMEEK